MYEKRHYFDISIHILKELKTLNKRLNNFESPTTFGDLNIGQPIPTDPWGSNTDRRFHSRQNTIDTGIGHLKLGGINHCPNVTSYGGESRGRINVQLYEIRNT